VQRNPLKGFWLVSAASLLIAPFLTNDGVCLLFVQLILDAFEGVKAIEDQLATKNQNMLTNTPEQRALIVQMKEMPLETGDAIYFLLTLACSSNIGSSLTYTGNPQNMIVAEDAAPVLPPIKFLGIMLLPTLSTWLITTYWIQRCWLYSKGRVNHNGNFPVSASEPEHLAEEMNHDGTRNPLQSAAALCIPASALSPKASLSQSAKTPTTAGAGAGAMSPIMSPRRRRAKDREAMMEQVTYYVSSPFPYMILILLAIMIIMIFVNVMPIAGLSIEYQINS
jgi:Na+/H+ antiporter NhaD/arsenite permease-like protein